MNFIHIMNSENTPSQTTKNISKPEAEIIGLMEQCIRIHELPSQPPAKKAAAHRMREYLRKYPGYVSLNRAKRKLTPARISA